MTKNKEYTVCYKWGLIIVGFLFSVVVALAQDPTSELMNQAESAMNSGRYAEAIRLYSQVFNLPVATDGQKKLADERIAYCRTQERHLKLNQRVREAENLFLSKKYDECIEYCKHMLEQYSSNIKFRNLISQCNDSIAAENNRLMISLQEDIRLQRLSEFKTTMNKAYRYYSTLQYNESKAVYDGIRRDYPDLKDSVPDWTFRCDSIVISLAKHEAIDWNLIWALNGIREKGSINYIGNLSEGYFVVSLNNGSLCLLTPQGEWTYLPNTGIVNDDWLRFDSGLLGPLYFHDEGGFIRSGGGYYSKNRGFINASGERILCDIVNKNDDKGIYIGPYANGYAIAWQYKGTDKKYGVINMRGETVIPFKYDNIYCLSGGFVGEKGNKVELIDKSYTVIYKFKGHIVTSHYTDCVVIYYDDNKCQLLINSDLSMTDNVNPDYKGDVYLKAAYSYPYSGEYALITDDTKWFDKRYKTFGSIWYFVDRNGIPLKNSQNYNKNSRFHNGLAPILREGGWGLIDKFGNTTFIEDYK